MSRNKFEDGSLNKNNSLQMQQKLIHYRSELASFQNKIKQAELNLEKEKIRNQYLQEKLFEAQNTNLESYEKEISSLKMKLLASEVALEEEKKRAKAIQEKYILSSQIEKQEVKKEIEPLLGLQSYFNYSFLYTPQEEIVDELIEIVDDHNITIIGDMVLDNYGTADLHQPIICIKITPTNAGHLSGKIATNRLQLDDVSNANLPQDEWKFVHDDWKERIKKSGEYWIKPSNSSIIQPKQKLTFSNFEFTLSSQMKHTSILIEAFSYCREFPNGIPALNKIIINV
ncbi:hypothetical protein [Bacillus nitroreducens]